MRRRSPGNRAAALQIKAARKRANALVARAYRGWGQGMLRDAARRWTRNARRLERKADKILSRARS